MKALRAMVLLILGVLLAVSSFAADEAEKTFYRTFFEGQISSFDKAFAGVFLQAVPEPKIKEIASLYIGKLGAFREAIGRNGKYDLLFAKGKTSSTIHLDKSGKVDGLWFGGMTLLDDSFQKIAEEWKALPGSSAVTILRNGTERVLDIGGDQALGVGSSFKLFILQLLDDQVKAGKRKPTDVVPLNPDWFSLPSGILQSWPKGAPVTLDTLANLMISMSDNTATDHLLFLLGREDVERISPPTVRPFLSTMEMFRLKYGPEERAKRFIDADEKGKREILADMAGEKVTLDQVRSDPYLIDSVEWFISTRALAELIHALRKLPSIGINPGLVSKEKWNLCGFKGGSEPGVLNYTLVLQKSPASDTFSLSATLNNPAGDDSNDSFTTLVLRLISLLEN